ncbi:MAG: carboxypeptidase-like regulatory domain-containing protein [Thermoanaerobaculia bacterium]
MRRFSAATVVSVLLLAGPIPAFAASDPSFIDVLGSVTNAAAPVEDALVLAFDLGSGRTIQTFTDSHGAFHLPSIPAGIYRIIAVKRGLNPAVAMVIPGQRDRKVVIRMRTSGELSENERDEIWEVRRSIPPDVLRQLNVGSVEEASQASNAFEGSMASLAGVSSTEQPAFSKAALSLRGTFGDGWAVDVEGHRSVFDTDPFAFSANAPAAQASGVVMQLRSGADESYRYATSRASWIGGAGVGGADQTAGFESHQFDWRNRESSVRVRYSSEENLFSQPYLNGERIEVAGDTNVYHSQRADVMLLVRLEEERSASEVSSIDPMRTAGVSTHARYEITPSVAVQYGMQTRIGTGGNEWAPETGAEVKIVPGISLIVSGLYKMIRSDSGSEEYGPYLVGISDPGAAPPRYRYALGLVTGNPEHPTFTAIASVTQIDSIIRIGLDDRFESFWDGVYLLPGDQQSELSLEYQKDIGSRFAVAVMAIGGKTASADVRSVDGESTYLVTTVHSTWLPSGTSVDVSYRYIDQASRSPIGATPESERLNFRMAQSLRLPIDLRLLVGFDLARSVDSPVAMDQGDPAGYSKRVLGGLSFAF